MRVADERRDGDFADGHGLPEQFLTGFVRQAVAFLRVDRLARPDTDRRIAAPQKHRGETGQWRPENVQSSSPKKIARPITGGGVFL